MSHGLLEILRYFLLALIWLFFIYAARMVIVEVKRTRGNSDAQGTETTSSSNRQGDRSNLRLSVLEPSQDRGQTFDLGGEVTLGRSAACVVTLEGDTFASSVHARVYPQNGEFWVEDLNSTNGTFVNDRRLSQPVRLRRGDLLKVGATVLEVTR